MENLMGRRMAKRLSFAELAFGWGSLTDVKLHELD
jgi:hypothetical protein